MSEQSLMALEVANRHRVGAAQLRREMASGVISIAAALDDPRAQCMPIGRLLCSQPGVGPTKANKLLNRHRIWPTRRVRDLTANQRRVISSSFVADALKGTEEEPSP